MTATRRTLPLPTADSEEFWRGCHAGVLRMQRCDACVELIWFPRGICVHCESTALTWVELSGLGRVYSYSQVARTPSEAFRPGYLLALVDLDEGPRMMSHIVSDAPDEAVIGMRVRVEFDRQSAEIALPVFVPFAPSAGRSRT